MFTVQKRRGQWVDHEIPWIGGHEHAAPHGLEGSLDHISVEAAVLVLTYRVGPHTVALATQN